MNRGTEGLKRNGIVDRNMKGRKTAREENLITLICAQLL